VTDSHKAEIVHAPPAALADRAIHPLIAQIASGGFDPVAIEKMMDLQERFEANEARKAYAAAMTRLKAALPSIIARDGKVDYTPAGKERVFYRHATLSGVVDAVVPHLTAHGFTHSWPSRRLPNGHVEVTCKLSHCEGHSESCSLDAAVDGSGGKNSIQAVGSTVSYLERYTILSLLGLATGDMPTGEEPKTELVEGVDVERNLLAVGAARKAGLDLDALCQEFGRRPEAWTALDRERVRDRLPKTKRAPKENADGSLTEDPPKSEDAMRGDAKPAA
jgi:hypothetical protein